MFVKKSTIKTLAMTVCLIIVIAGLLFVWHSYVSPTRIAVINYRDFQYAQFLEAKDNRFIRIDRIDLENLADTDVGDYAAVFVFGMGLNLDDDMKEAIRQGIDDGANVHVTYTSNDDSDLSNLAGDDLEYVENYFDNGGRKNIRALFNYCRRVLDDKTLFSEDITEAQEIPRDVFYHLGEDTFFKSFDEYSNYYKSEGLYKEGRPKVCLLTSIVGPRSIDRAYADDMIRLLEARNINVYPIAGFMKRLAFMKAVEPDLVVYVPHGRLAPGQTQKAIDWLKERNIPLLCPVDAFMPYDEWMATQKGISGGMLSQSIVMTELDGAIEPFTISAQYPNEEGLQVNRSIPDRIERFADRVSNWLKLRDKDNADKKIAIVYYKGPGRNAMVAGGLEVAPSLLNVLRHLKESGYTTGPLPKTTEEFTELIQRHGPVLGPYALGAFDTFLAEGNPELVSTATYLSWVREQVTEEAYADVLREYGEAPGDYLTLAKGDSSYIALPRVEFGNVVLVPQLLPGIGDNTSSLVHGAKKAPPHPYLAEYLWIRNGFKADAIMHFGTHGSFEFTPWKQTALSSNDWSDALIGDLPHPYVYVINNIGEALIAKRRSYAAIISHLTPPFIESDLYGELAGLGEAIEGYHSANDPALQNEYIKTIRKGVLAIDLQKDLGWNDDDIDNLGDDHVETLHNYLHTIGQEKITKGLYTLGRSYEDGDVSMTSRLMAIDPVTFSLAKIDAEKNVFPDSLLSDPSYIDSNYRSKAFKIIDRIRAGMITKKDVIDADDLKRLKAWEEAHKTMSEDEMFASMMSMSKKGGKDENAEAAFDPERLEDLVVKITVDAEKTKLLKSWKNEDAFKKSSSLLNPENMKKARNVAKLIKPMREALDRIEEPDIKEILTAMQNPEAKSLVFSLMDNPGLQDKRDREAAQISQMQAERALEAPYKEALFSASNISVFKEALNNMDTSEIDSLVVRLGYFTETTGLQEALSSREEQDARAMEAMLNNPGLIKQALEAAKKQRSILEDREKNYVMLVRNLSEALDNVGSYGDALASSTMFELDGVVDALSGGYIEPSTGGDPIANPQSVPTGRNLSAIDAEKTPTAEAWNIGVKIAEQTIRQKLKSSGEYPKKVAVTLWGGEFIRSRGVPIAMIFHLLGVQPLRNSRGAVHDVALIPAEKLGRPRIDVIVQTSGQFRDIAASRIFLINKAVKLASEADDPPGTVNHVKEGTLAAEKIMKEQGLSPLDARLFSTARVFGGVNGNYGTGIMGMVEAGDRWEDDDEIAEQYLKNMGAVYTEEHWGHYEPGLFEGALQNTDTVVHDRSSNTWGPLSLDHVYEFMGGINATVRHVTGNDPDAYFSDMRNKHNPAVQDAKSAIWTETRTTLLNPKYITALQEGGASSAETFAESFRNTYGWNVMKPEAVDNEVWEGFYDVYVKDSYNLNMKEYFKDKNPYALQEMSAVMLETIRKGYWDADQDTRTTLANLHAELVKDHEAGCSGFVCDNAKLREFISNLITPDLKHEYSAAIEAVRSGGANEQIKGMKLEKETLTLEAVKRVVTENAATLITFFAIIALFSAAVILGARRRNR